MSTTISKAILLAVAVILPACGDAAITSSSASPVPGAVVPIALSPSPVVAEATAVVGHTAPVDPDLDPDPVPGEEPDDLLPLEPLGEPGDPAPPTPVDPFVRVPFAIVPIPVPFNPVPPFLPVTLVADLQADTPAAGGRTFTAATGCGSHCITDRRYRPGSHLGRR